MNPKKTTRAIIPVVLESEYVFLTLEVPVFIRPLVDEFTIFAPVFAKSTVFLIGSPIFNDALLIEFIYPL
jgi:hypothetical protein